MNFKIFYSWQSDLPNSTNRSFIETALENAVKSINIDNDIEIKPVVDRDTAGIPGSPDITEAIFSKIDVCQAFVCDVSIINYGSDSRFTPNPNVLIELGYALKLLGDKRIIMIMNTAFGHPEDLPFDLRTRRIITYHSPKDATERATERRNLEQKLFRSIRDIGSEFLTVNRVATLYEQTLNAIENDLSNSSSLSKKFMKQLKQDLDNFAPVRSNDREYDDALIEALDTSLHLVVQYANITQAIAQNNNKPAASAIFEGFEQIIESYYPPAGFSGQWLLIDFDYYRFIGHELFVILVAHLIEEDRLELLGELLNKALYVKNRYPQGSEGIVTFEYICQSAASLAYRNQRLSLRRIYLHGDILNDRHTKGELSKTVPVKIFVDADYFLFLNTELYRAETSVTILWKPHSALYLNETPKFLVKSIQRSYAQRLSDALNLKDINLLKIRYPDRANRVYELFENAFFRNRIPVLDAELIASK